MMVQVIRSMRVGIKHKYSLKGQAVYKANEGLVLTVSLAGVMDPAEVLVAAAFIGALGVVADVGTYSKLQTLILIWEN